MTARTQLNRGLPQRLMYVESKGGQIDGACARIGWVKFSKTGSTIYYRNLVLQRLKGRGVRGNFFDTANGAEFWVSGVKMRGSNVHPAENGVAVEIDADAVEAYRALRDNNNVGCET